MTVNFLEKQYAFNNWATEQIIDACLTLTDAQLDAAPTSATFGTIRDTLTHMVRSQHGYLTLLTLPPEKRERIEPDMAELKAAARASGEAILKVVRGETPLIRETQIPTANGHIVEPWVVLVQIINHAHEHREQIKSMLTALGVTPPDIDGWDYGLATNTLVKVEQ